MDTLIVEDDPGMRELLKSVLEERGHRVSAFVDAESAWQACQAQHFPLLIVDWMLPGMDGLDLCRKIRSSQINAGNLILVITARTEVGDLEQVLAAGADDYLAKPVNLQLLNVRLTIAEQRVKQLQQQIVSTNELLLQKDIIENGVEGIVLIKASDATIHYCNRRFEILFGYEPGELIGKHISIINAAHEKSPQETADEINRHLEKNGMWSGENLNCKKDGTTLWTYISVSTFEHPELGALWITYQKDISESKKTVAALLDHAALYRTAVETSVDGFWAVDARGRLCEVNNAYIRMSGYSRDELLNMSIPELEAQERPEETAAHIEKILREGHDQFESIHRKKDGSLWPVQIATSYSPLAGGRFFAFVTDLTERQRKDFLLQQQSRLASMGEMIGNIAHQWRQPINALGIILYDLEDAIQHGQCDQNYLHSSVEKSHAIIKRMSETIDDFRNFFRIDNNVAEFDLHQSVQNCLKIMEAVLQHQQISVTTKHTGSVMVSGRSGDFSQGLLNLLANAKDAITANNIAHGLIAIEIAQDEHNGIVIISDNGGGMAADIMPKIFDPYFTTKADGIGIGLYMTRMAIEKNMRGHIEAGNFGQGARFIIKLPRSDSGEFACQN